MSLVTPETTRRFGASLAGGALLVGAVTAVARVVGFGRWCVRVSAYSFLLVTDRYPPFSLAP